jgi:hypothetical protein
MYEPRLNVKKEGFADFINHYAAVKSGTYDNDFLYSGIIPEIMETHDKIVRNCLLRKGFSEEFIQERIKDFHTEVSRSEDLWSCGYFYKDDLLFVINILIAFTIFAPIVYAIWYCIFYKSWKAGCCGKLKFKQFKQFYAIAPQKWELSDGYVSYLDSRELMIGSFYFSTFDSVKYYFWKTSVERQKDSKENNKILMKILENIQKDIDDYRKDLK